MPDRFNQVFIPLFETYADELGSQVNEQDESYVRALYLYLDNLEETGSYQFALLALLKHNTPDNVRLSVDEQIEELTQEWSYTKALPSRTRRACQETQSGKTALLWRNLPNT